MSIEHLRNLAKYGIITDIDPYDLAPEAFSSGVNVRFRNGKVIGAPVFRNVLHLGTVSPRYVFSSFPTSGQDLLFVGYENGTVSYISGANESAYSIAGYVTNAVEAQWSHTTLASVTYVNRSDRAPWYLRTSDSTFQNLGVVGGAPASWDSTWTCKLLRTCGGALVALNVTKGATANPTMVKTSSIPLAGTIPSSWDQTQSNTLATENILADMEGGIVDACPLGTDLIIYGEKQAYRMAPNGASSVFSYLPLPFSKGSINGNCSIELDGTNVVFGPNDIWRHDGNSEKSICDGRVRDYIYSSINMSKASRCFVVHNPKLTEISFCYVSGDGLTAFNSNTQDGCNRAAVWNYGNDTWTFDDLPYVYSGCSANLSNPLTYDQATASYETMGGSYQDLQDGFKRAPCYVGDASTTYSLSTSLYAQDLYGEGSTVNYAVDINATKPRYVARDGIDLDELNDDLRGNKVLVSIYPQVRLGSGAAYLQINGGSGEGFNDPPSFVGYQNYDGDTLTKCDFNTSGRYLSLQILFNDYKVMTIAGFDLEIRNTSRRG